MIDVHIPFLIVHISVKNIFKAQSTNLKIFKGLGERQWQFTNQWKRVVQL